MVDDDSEIRAQVKQVKAKSNRIICSTNHLKASKLMRRSEKPMNY
jgi:hypothetical protein